MIDSIEALMQDRRERGERLQRERALLRASIPGWGLPIDIQTVPRPTYYSVEDSEALHQIANDLRALAAQEGGLPDPTLERAATLLIHAFQRGAFANADEESRRWRSAVEASFVMGDGGPDFQAMFRAAVKPLIAPTKPGERSIPSRGCAALAQRIDVEADRLRLARPESSDVLHLKPGEAMAMLHLRGKTARQVRHIYDRRVRDLRPSDTRVEAGVTCVRADVWQKVAAEINSEYSTLNGRRQRESESEPPPPSPAELNARAAGEKSASLSRKQRGRG